MGRTDGRSILYRSAKTLSRNKKKRENNTVAA